MPVEDRTSLQDICFLGLQRPAMLFGVPYLGCTFNLSVNVLLGGWVGMLSGHRWWMFIWWLGAIPAIHVLMKMVCNRDHHLFRLFMLWLQTKAKSSLDSLYGGASLAPMPVRMGKRPSEFPVSLSWRDD